MCYDQLLSGHIMGPSAPSHLQLQEAEAVTQLFDLRLQLGNLLVDLRHERIISRQRCALGLLGGAQAAQRFGGRLQLGERGRVLLAHCGHLQPQVGRLERSE